jgi:hypothetical protein
MGQSGVGMILGHASVNMFYILGVAIVILGGVLFYGMTRAGRLGLANAPN